MVREKKKCLRRRGDQWRCVSVVLTDDGPNEVDSPRRFLSLPTLVPREEEVRINGSDSGT